MPVADPLELRRGLHRSIDLGETRSVEGKDMGGGFLLSLMGFGGPPPRKSQKNMAQMVNFGGISMRGITLEPLGRF